MRDLTDWLARPEPERFPYDAVLAEYHRVGRHFVAPDVLDRLAATRQALTTGGAATLPQTFLNVALDKHDGRYDYRGYIALDLLPPRPARAVVGWRDGLVAQLLTDVIEFELRAADGETDFLPAERPPADLVTKRCRLALRCLGRPLRPGPAGVDIDADPRAAASRVSRSVRAGLSDRERLMLRITMLPVDVVHDEYLFIRVLQASEVTLALVDAQLQGMVETLLRRAPRPAAGLRLATETMSQLAPLFSLLATMQVQSFRRFRRNTEGASAIQSDSYKRIESLCAKPDAARLESVAYGSVPEVQKAVRAGRVTIDDALAQAAGSLSSAERAQVLAAMGEFAAALTRWRRAHYGIALRMLDDLSGSGYTSGTPYLREVRDIPVFRHLGDEMTDQRADRVAVTGEPARSGSTCARCFSRAT